MSNLLASISQAGSGLSAAQYGLSVVSQNISNADTPGYTREVSNQAELGGAGMGQLFGVTVLNTSRETDPILNAQLRIQQAKAGLADTTSTQLQSIEQVFPEPSTSGLGAQLSQYWSDWAQVGNNPGSGAVRQTLLQDAGSVATTLNSMSASLSDIASGTSQQLSANVTAANTAAAQLATLNGQIAVTTATGGNANTLLDQRDQLLSTLSTLVGGVATIAANGSATVTVGQPGQPLVSDITSSTMAVDSSYNVSVGGTAVALGTGSVAAQVSALTTTIPGYQAQLDAVAQSLATTSNQGQANGYDLNGNAGTAIFGTSDGTGTVTAANIVVTLSDPSGIAASGTAGATPGTGDLGDANALTLSASATATGSPDARYASLVGTVGSDSANAQQLQTTQDSVVSSITQQQQSVSGVNYDQEVSNMLMYQQAYQASAKVLSTANSMFQTLFEEIGS